MKCAGRWGLTTPLLPASGPTWSPRRTDDQLNSAFRLRPGTTAIDGSNVGRATGPVYAADFASRTSTYGGWLEPRLAGPHFALAAALRLDGGS